MLLETSYDDVLSEVEHDLLTLSCQRAQWKAAASLDFAIYNSNRKEGRDSLSKCHLSLRISSLIFQTGLIIIVFLFACLRKNY